MGPSATARQIQSFDYKWLGKVVQFGQFLTWADAQIKIVDRGGAFLDARAGSSVGFPWEQTSGGASALFPFKCTLLYLILNWML